MWNKTKSSEKRLISYNRTKAWICRLLKKEVSIPTGHRMRQEDYQNALDHMIDAHASGITQVAYLRSCIAPKRPEVNEYTTNSSDMIDESNEE